MSNEKNCSYSLKPIANNSSGNSVESTSCKRSVQFSDETQIFDVPRYSVKESKDLWYKRSEYTEFAAERKDIIQLYQDLFDGNNGKKPTEDDDFCVRGLESLLTSDARLLSSQRYKTVTQTVLDMQKCTEDPECIRACAVRLSACTTLEALERAAQDAIFSGFTDTTSNIRQKIIEEEDKRLFTRPCIVIGRKPSVRDCGGADASKGSTRPSIPNRKPSSRQVTKTSDNLEPQTEQQDLSILLVSPSRLTMPQRQPSFKNKGMEVIDVSTVNNVLTPAESILNCSAKKLGLTMPSRKPSLRDLVNKSSKLTKQLAIRRLSMDPAISSASCTLGQ